MAHCQVTRTHHSSEATVCAVSTWMGDRHLAGLCVWDRAKPQIPICSCSPNSNGYLVGQGICPNCCSALYSCLTTAEKLPEMCMCDRPRDQGGNCEVGRAATSWLNVDYKIRTFTFTFITENNGRE